MDQVSKNKGDKIMSRTCALDPGTMFFQVAEMGDKNKINIKTIRNVFVDLDADEDTEDILLQNKWHYVRDGNKYYIIGEDAMKFAMMFPNKVELRRPLKDGVLNKKEKKKMLILAELINYSLGNAPDDKSVVCTCVSSDPIDGSQDNAFHRARLEGMLKRNGWNIQVIEEGLAVVLSERPTIVEKDGSESPYSGIGISWGSGRTNCVVAYKGMPIIGISIACAGDFVDEQVSNHTDVSVAQVTAKKERFLDFDNLDYDDDVIFALDVYYEKMIKNVMNSFSKKFMEIKSEFDTPLDIVVAGGTSLPNGFCGKLERVIGKLELPFKIKEIKIASDPKNAVVKGCLTKAVVVQKKLMKNSGKKAKKENDEAVVDNDLSEILGEQNTDD